MASEDGFIGGYFIPKDSLILTNLWYVLSNSWSNFLFTALITKGYVTWPRNIPRPFQVWPRAPHCYPSQGCSTRSTGHMLRVRTSNLSWNVSRRSIPFCLHRHISCRFQHRKNRCEWRSHRSSSREHIRNHQVFTFIIVTCMKDYLILPPSYPKPFQCAIKPRSQRAASLIADIV